MNKKVYFIADFFSNQVTGGGELNNDELIKCLNKKNILTIPINSNNVDLNFLKSNRDCFFIISNFVNLSYNCREWITYNLNYIIYEHDHKYLASRNPAVYKNFKAPSKELRNYFFYKNARKVLCQSNFHKDILQKNLDFSNVVSVGGNLWSIDTLNIIREFAKKTKNDSCSILESHIPHKNTERAISYCLNKNLKYTLVKDNNYINFLDKLSNNKKLVFFPKTPETLSRICCEARMMGMSVVANQLVGATYETWFKMKGDELIDYMVQKRQEIVDIVVNEINNSKKPPQLPKVSIVATFYKAEKYLESFLKDITSLDMFDESELILVDSGSPGKEKEIVKNYTDKYKNIHYYRYDHRFKPNVGHNIAIMKSSAPYVSWAMIDDRKNKQFLSILYDEIEKNTNIDLVYGDCLTTADENETFENTKSTTLSEHSLQEFSKENMIKCLPGPMPLWSKRIHEKSGFFDSDETNYCDDWEMWLRAVNNGCQFKKVSKTVGLYLTGGRSQQENNLDQRKEEASVFFKYSHIFGKNYSKYYSYFKQFMDLK